MSGQPGFFDLDERYRARSKVRSAIEHVFADQKHRMRLFVRTIGIARARTKICLASLAYNLRRYLYLGTAAAKA